MRELAQAAIDRHTVRELLRRPGRRRSAPELSPHRQLPAASGQDATCGHPWEGS